MSDEMTDTDEPMAAVSAERLDELLGQITTRPNGGAGDPAAEAAPAISSSPSAAPQTGNDGSPQRPWGEGNAPWDRAWQEFKQRCPDLCADETAVRQAAAAYNPGEAADISRDFALRRIFPSTAVEFSDAAGKRAIGSLGRLNLDPRLKSAGVGGALGFLAAPFDAGASAVAGMLAGYFVQPKVRQGVLKKALQSDAFLLRLTGEGPVRFSSMPELMTTFGAIAAKEGATAAGLAVARMMEDLAEIGNAVADSIIEGAADITDDLRKEAERLRFDPAQIDDIIQQQQDAPAAPQGATPLHRDQRSSLPSLIGSAEAATLPVGTIARPQDTVPAPATPLPPRSRVLKPDPDARRFGSELEDIRRHGPAPKTEKEQTQ